MLISISTKTPIVLKKDLALVSVEAVSAVIPIMARTPRTGPKKDLWSAQPKSVQIAEEGKQKHLQFPQQHPQPQQLQQCYGAPQSTNTACVPRFPHYDRKRLDGTQAPNQEQQQEGESWLPPVDLSHLSEEERKIAEGVLREEADVFCRDEKDQRDVPDMKMEN